MVIFDMDGVLIDSEGFYKEINYQYFKDLGVEISDEVYNGFIGISADKMWGYIKDTFQLGHDLSTLKAGEKDRKYAYLSAEPLTPIAGIPEFLELLKEKGEWVCLASSSPKRNIEVVIEKMEIAPYFDFVISGEEVKNGKPAPDIFLAPAAKFQVSPQHCVVVEDSNNGVRAAKAAGMYCTGFVNPNSGNQNLSAADLVIHDFSTESTEKIIKLLNY